MLQKNISRVLSNKLYKMLRSMHPTPKPESVELKVELTGNSATIHLGDISFDIQSNVQQPIRHEVYDFALYGAVAIALSQNLAIKTDLPISRSCHSAISEIYEIMRVWSVRKIYVQPFSLSNIVDDPVISRNKPGLMCMSGGVDSTFAAVSTPKEAGFSHGMLIAGADYPSAESKGYKELSQKVHKLCNGLNMPLIEVETSIRKIPFNWEMMHVLCLTMALNFHSSIFGKGAIAADLTKVQEISFRPWSNTGPVVSALSLPYFPLEHIGCLECRSDKLKFIYESQPELIRYISVCFSDNTTAGNCGFCRKCIRTKLSLYALGLDYIPYFDDDNELSVLVQSLPFPKTQAFRRIVLSWLIESAGRTPEGEVKQALDQYIEELVVRIKPLGKR